jgi:hypothetical protein
MKRMAFLSVLVVLALTTGVTLTPARSATPASGLLEYLPDGKAVVIIDFQKIAGSSLWATINAQDKLKSEIDKAQSEMSNLGITLSDVHTVALVFSGASLSSPTVAVSGGFEQNSLLERLRASGKIKLSSEKYKGIDIYKATAIAAQSRPKAGTKSAAPAKITDVAKDETSFVFHDSATVVAGSLEAVRASVDVKTGAKPGLTQNTQLSNALSQNPSSAIRFALSLTSSMTNGLKSADLPVDFSSISMVFGTVDIGQSIELDATLRSDTVDNAKSLSEKLNSLLTLANGLVAFDPKLAAIGEALKTVRIVNAETDVRITGSLPMELLNSLISSTAKK